MAKKNVPKITEAELKALADKVIENVRAGDESAEALLFLGQFKTYQNQEEIKEKLHKEIESGETIVTKEYVKGRQNIVVNPCIQEYGKQVQICNQTVASLIRLSKQMKITSKDDGEDPLLLALRGDDLE